MPLEPPSGSPYRCPLQMHPHFPAVIQSTLPRRVLAEQHAGRELQILLKRRLGCVGPADICHGSTCHLSGLHSGGWGWGWGVEEMFTAQTDSWGAFTSLFYPGLI